MTSVTQFTEACCEHGEGPVWDGRSGRLALVDMLRGDVLFADEGGAVTRRPTGSSAAAWPRTAGPGLRTLYITTSALGLPPGREPAAGSVFRCEPGVAGLPAHPYRG